MKQPERIFEFPKRELYVFPNKIWLLFAAMINVCLNYKTCLEKKLTCSRLVVVAVLFCCSYLFFLFLKSLNAR